MASKLDNVTRKGFIAGLASGALALAGCSHANPENIVPAETEEPTTEEAPQVDLSEFSALEFDNHNWHYDALHSVWWQLGLSYCIKPAASSYENLAIYVPGAYLKPTDENADMSKASSSDTFEVTFDTTATIGAFTVETAPIVMPINAPNYAAQSPASAYLFEGLGDYLNAGLVYVYAGFRGRANGYDNNATSGDGFFVGGAPWAVTELKAAIRYLRYNSSVLPGDTNRIVPFGLGSGGLLAAVLGTSGNSSLYDDYLAEIGAATHDGIEGAALGDNIAAVAAWCPDATPPHADEAYEWELGQFDETSETRADGIWTHQLSQDLAESYAAYVNSLNLRDADGNSLYLDQTDGGVWTDGTYYEYLLGLAEDAAKYFLSNTQFPATVGGLEQPSGYFPGSGKSVEEMKVTFSASSISGSTPLEEDEPTEEDTAAANPDLVTSDTAPANNEILYATRRDYINARNINFRWLTYNDNRQSARISGLSSYVSEYRAPTLGVPAFDKTDCSSEENQLFGNGETETLHFSQDIADIISQKSDVYAQIEGYDDQLSEKWSKDLLEKDELGSTIETRRNMYDPLYFVSGASEAYGTADVAGHWRLNVGMAQTSTPLSATVNLALLLRAYEGVSDVEFIPVWQAARTLAEQDNASAPEALGLWITSLFTE